MAFSLEKIEMHESTTTVPDRCKHDCSFCIAIESTFSQKGPESMFLDFKQFSFLEETVRQNVSHGRKVDGRIEVPGVSLVTRTCGDLSAIHV